MMIGYTRSDMRIYGCRQSEERCGLGEKEERGGTGTSYSEIVRGNRRGTGKLETAISVPWADDSMSTE